MRSFKSLNTKEKLEYIGIMAIYPLILLFEQMGKSVKFLNTRKRQITASVLTVCMLLTMIPVMSLTAFAETTTTVGAFTVTDGVEGTEYTYADGVLTVLNGAELTIANTDPNTATSDRIEVASGANANITLAGVNIVTSGQNNPGACPLDLQNSGECVIKLQDGTTNILNASATTDAGPGIWTPNGKQLTIKGNGTLETKGGNSWPGIGRTGNTVLVIESGNIVASGGSNASGIGGSWGFESGSITINGGSVTATGGRRGAGIGGGFQGTGSNITISGGTVTATGGRYAAGIGGGSQGTGSNITISGGTVKAVAGEYCANTIGGGSGKDAVTPTDGNGNNVYLLTGSANGQATVTIDGKEYTAIDGNYYVYLPSGFHNVTVEDTTTIYYVAVDGTVSIPEICGAFLVAGGTKGTDYTYESNVLTIKTATALAIANVKPNEATTTDRIEVAKDASANITLAGVNIDVSATGGYNNPGYAAFKIADNSTGNVTITLADGTTNTLKSGYRCAGLQKNGDTTTGKLTITGTGSLTAEDGYDGAGIGGGYNSAGSNITISGGTVTATGSDYGAGIGGGSQGTGSNITISGGTVTAKGGNYGAGIGGGYYGSSSNIIISGGSVKATAGNDANAIGGGYNKSAVTPTDGADDVYLLIIENPNGEKIYIDGTEYTPNKHDTEKKVYAYLTGESHTVKVGEKTTNYVFDANDNTFKILITEDDVTINPTSLVYNGSEQKPTVTVTVGGTILTENTDYTVAYSDNTDAGKGKVTVTGKGSYTGTVTKEFDITKATPIAPANPTASAINFGKTLADSTLTDGWVWADSTIVPTVSNSGYTAYYNIVDTDNYDWSRVEGYNETSKRLERTVTVDLNVFKLKDSVSTVIDTVYENTVNVNLSDYITVLDEACVASYSIEGELPQGVTLSNGKLIGEYNAGATQTVKIKVSAENYLSFTFELTFAYNAPTYTVTIPESVTVTNGEGTFTVKAEDVVLGDTKKLSVTIQDTDNEEGMYLTSANDEIGYTLSKDSATVDIGDVILSLNGQGLTAASDSAALKLAITDTPKYAEEYKGTITFTVAVEDK